MKILTLRLSALLLMTATGFAESINPPTSPQTAPMTGQEKKNLDMVLTWWREVLDGGHVELAPKYQVEDYIQHNPNVPTGRAGFVSFLSKLRQPTNPVPAALSNPPVVKGAKGDYVWLIFEHEDKDPRDPSKTYHSNSFEVLRIQNGKVQEHWDSAQKMPGTCAVPSGVSPKPPMQWNTRQAFPGRTTNAGARHRRTARHVAVRPPRVG